MTYPEAVAYLASLAPRGWRLGLDRMNALARRAGLTGNLGNGHTQYLHVAGTNGKGSVTAYLQTALIELGYRTGGFFSPFVYDLRERVQFGGELISEPDFARLVTDLVPVVETFSEADFGGVTEFELKTALGFRYWTERNCDYVALEVGLGGRLDSTTIVDPACSIIVSIGLDHTSILGETYAEIAREKAGIIKPGRPVVIGNLPAEAIEVVQHIAIEHEAPLWQIGREIFLAQESPEGWHVETPLGSVSGVKPGIVGAKQPENAALAIAALFAAGVPNLDGDTLRRGIAKTSAPGRFERRKVGIGANERLVILDGAHNGESAEVLAQTLKQIYPEQPFALITGMVQGHDPARLYAPLVSHVERAFVAPIDFWRARPPAELAQEVASTLSMEPCESVNEAIGRAWQTELPILVTGSFYLVGEVGRQLDRMATNEQVTSTPSPLGD